MDVRLHRAEQLGDHGDDPFEVPGPTGAFHQRGERARDHASLKLRRIHRGTGRCEHRGNSGLSAHLDVIVDRAWIAVEVCRLIELQGVDEDRHDDVVAAPRGVVEELSMAGVERAHGGHDADGATADAPLGRPGAHLIGSGDRDHVVGHPSG